jgi:hypothetical protein
MVNQVMVATKFFFEVMTSTLPKGNLGSVASLLAAAFYQGNPDRNHKLWNIVSSERYIEKKFGRHHDLVDHYEMSVSQMTMDMFHLS